MEQENGIGAIMDGSAREERMTSSQIAEITGKNHKDLLRSIRNMEPAWEKVQGRKFALSFRTRQLANGGTKEDPYYELTKEECLYIATKFNDEARARLVLRWKQLEEEKRKKAKDERRDIDLRLAEFLERQADSGKFQETYSQIIRTKAVNMAAGENILPMPRSKAQKKRLSSSDIASKLTETLGKETPISPNMVGKLANRYGLKTPENGEMVEDIAKNGRQVQSFEYFEEAVPKFIESAKKFILENPKSRLAVQD